jgi:DNA-binding IclR family transcriptional regulator
MGSPKTIATIEKAFGVVEELARMDGGRATDLADRLEMPISTVYDHLTTLERLEYVVEREDGYHPSMRFLKLGAERRSKLRLYESAASEVEGLADETGELASLMIEEHDRGVVLSLEEGERAIDPHNYAGIRMPLHTTALGKAILAHLPAERRASILDRYGDRKLTERTITDRETLETQLERVAERGYAVDRGELIAGVLCVATPIVDTDDRVHGSICVCGPISRLREEDAFERIKDAVLQAGNVIEVNLGYSAL